MSLDAWNVSPDEKDAVTLVGVLVRAIKKWDADERTKKRAAKAEDWLRRYNTKYPSRMLRDSATLSHRTTPPADHVAEGGP